MIVLFLTVALYCQQAINSWLPQAETKFANMSKIAADPRSAKIQIEELKVCHDLTSTRSAHTLTHTHTHTHTHKHTQATQTNTHAYKLYN